MIDLAQPTATPAARAAEELLLGCLLLDGSLVREVEGVVRVEHIADHDVRRLYQAMLVLHRAGQVPDLAAVLRQARATEDLAAFAAELRGGTGSTAPALHYARQVRDAGLSRICSTMLRSLGDRAAAGADSPECILGLARGAIDQLALQSTPADDSPFLTAQEFMARPAPGWLVPDVILDAGLTILVAQPAVGKSFFLLELALAVAQGRPLLQREEFTPTRTGWVLALLGESLASWSARLRAACDFHQVTPDGILICDRPPALGDPAAFSAFARGLDRECERRGSRPALVIVDTLSACAPGVDENSSKEVGVVVAHLQQLVRAGSPVVAAHHPAKSGHDARGSTRFLGDPDNLLRLDLEGRTRTLVPLKLRDFDKDKYKGASFELIPHLGSAVVRGSEAPTATWQFSTADPGLRAALQEHGFRLPGDPDREGGLQAGGVSLRELAATWDRLVPIVPTRKESRQQNDAVRHKRRRELVSLVARLVTSGALRIVAGTVSQSSAKTLFESFNATVRQVRND